MIRYCRACPAEELAAYGEFGTALEALDPRPEILYVWPDHTVTTLPLVDAPPVYVSDSVAWQEFCAPLLAQNRPTQNVPA